MAEMSVIWLRVAAALYSLGLLHAILTLVRRREHLFRLALAAFMFGSVFHFVSIIEEGIVNHRCPINNFYETLSMCTFLVALVYLLVHWRYKLESLSVFLFPLVFVMALVATLGNPVSAWSSPVVRNAWLTLHIVSTAVMFGLGGIFAEVLKDVAFRIAPVTKSSALEMIAEIKGYAVLKGARGAEPADIDALADAIVRLSSLAIDLKGQIAELDINPLFVFAQGKGVKAGDALIKPLVVADRS